MGANPLQTTAATADKHTLYEAAVQDVESEIDFVDDTYKAIRGRRAELLREDFCGTANTSCEWVRRRKDNRAIGVDLDPSVLEWGRTHKVGALKRQQQARIELRQRDVRSPGDPKVDIVLAMNFSYWIFETRKAMVRYFKTVRKSLRKDGVFFMDAYGGYDAPKELTEPRDCGDFTYIWDQHSFNPIDHHMECRIHFEFPDGSRMDNAFRYNWRLWSLPELTEMLHEAGFKKSTIFWEGTDPETNEGNGVYEPATRGDADAGWICYLAAEK